jgi:long-subunit acyl-CoA synthetase (AMP-forming)
MAQGRHDLLCTATRALMHARCRRWVVTSRHAPETPKSKPCLWAVPRRLAQALVYSKVRAAVGVRKVVISGGGSLAPHLDTFYETIGLPVLNGWGLSVSPS